jgi:hypothetical protein
VGLSLLGLARKLWIAAALGEKESTKQCKTPKICELLSAYLELSARGQCCGTVHSMRCDTSGGVGVVFTDGRCERLMPPAAREGDAQRALAEVAKDEPANKMGDSAALLGLALVWLWCDCFAEWETMATLCGDDARMFGAVGKPAVLAFKQKWLPGRPAPDGTCWQGNYSVDAIFEVDIGNLVVVAGFDCLITGKEGRGTDVIQFGGSEAPRLLVRGVQAVRHPDVARLA